jgi:hypothetical protein
MNLRSHSIDKLNHTSTGLCTTGAWTHVAIDRDLAGLRAPKLLAPRRRRPPRPQATPRPTPPEAMQLAELRPWLMLLAGVLLLCLQRWFAAKYKLGTGVPLAHTRKLMRSGLAGRSSAKPKQKPKRA